MNHPADLASQFHSLHPETGYDRRGFLVTALGAGFALATQPVAAQTAINTPAEGLLAGEVSIATTDGMMPAYRAQPASGSSFATLLVVQEIFGVHEHIKDVCRRLAKLGYQAIAPELYARQGDPRQYATIPEILSKLVSRVPDAQVMSDLDACAAWAKSNGGDAARLGITGFCWGGRITWLYAAHNAKVKAGVAWYGRLVGDRNANNPTYPVDVALKLNGPVLGLYGGADAGIPVTTVEEMRKALGAGSKSQIHVYEGMPHAFFADYRPSYRKDAADDGWKRCLAWMRANGVA